MNHDEIKEEWQRRQDEPCHCMTHPPCSACLNGKGIELWEFIEHYGPELDYEYPDRIL
jgi:hypothetical protein